MKKNTGRHPFKWMTYNDKKVRIDKEIAPLLSKMWALGIHTTNSCQEQCNFTCKHKYKVIKYKTYSFNKPIKTKNCNNSIWLAFESTKDVEKLYNIVAEYEPNDDNSMYGKMSCDRFVQTGQTRFKQASDGWTFSFCMTNEGVDGHWGRPKFGNKKSTQEMWIKDGCKKCKFVIQPQITFPKIHLQYVEDRLDLALKRKRK